MDALRAAHYNRLHRR